ncbi:hypothetical protein HPT27_01750 [Permianibacter sp. IMCC34836]|uniref:hypothetical protein n=1 Tax=Permianibacter fluminis TaxID=2738515 RepID=UPI0015539B8E|nr:hypothetical protein [Permianibacter fluminis]NQD35726.1 hypothetical protein [Permianibacter fluminis]
MLVVFGWVKQMDLVGAPMPAYCFNCQSYREWGHLKETEWATLFFIKILPFISKSRLICDGCRDEITLNSKAQEKIKELANASDAEEVAWIKAGFDKLIEAHQLQNKTEAQKQYIQSIRSSASSAERHVK